MRRKVLLVFLVAIFLIGCRGTEPTSQSPGSACLPPATKILEVELRPQEVDQWCWAASGQMVMEFKNRNVSQCLQANNRLSMTNCCLNPIPSDCNLPGWPEFEKYEFDYKRTTDEALSWDMLKEQIGCKNNPVAFSWGWEGRGGHMMVAVGYKTVNGVNFVYMHDPWETNVGQFPIPITYEEYVQGSTHSHWHDFYDFVHQGVQ